MYENECKTRINEELEEKLKGDLLALRLLLRSACQWAPPWRLRQAARRGSSTAMTHPWRITLSKIRRDIMWWLYALLSAVFAAATSILAKVGIENVNSHLATAVRTVVVVGMAWILGLKARSIVGLPLRSTY